MEISTKFNIGDKVWFHRFEVSIASPVHVNGFPDKILCGEVTHIILSKGETVYRIDFMYDIREYDLFNSSEEAVKAMKERYYGE